MTFITVMFLVGNIATAQKKYILKCDKNLLNKSQQIALSQIGTIEKTNRNDGNVKKYLAAFGLSAGNPYCAAGQYYCFLEASKQLDLPSKAIPIAKSALAQGVYNAAAEQGKLASYMPQPHDLIVWRKGRTSKGHIERIYEVNKNGWVETIAFNSSKIINGKKIEGVFMQRRNIKHPLGRLKIKGLVGFYTD